MGISKRYVSKSRGHCPARILPNLKANILIDGDGRACLAGFSLVTMVSGQSTDMSSCTPEGGTIQWMSPELIDPETFGLEKIRSTKESDCYALGMVIYEVLSGRTPFFPHNTPLVIQKVLQGKRPGRPEGEEGTLFTDGIWRTLELCWKHQPDERTGAKGVLPCFEGTPPLPLPSSYVGAIVETDTDGQLDATLSNSSTFLFHQMSQTHHQSSLRHNRPGNYSLWRRTPGSIKRSPSWCNEPHESTRRR